MEEDNPKDIQEDEEEEFDDDDIQKMSTMRSRKLASNKFSNEEIEDIQLDNKKYINYYLKLINRISANKFYLQYTLYFILLFIWKLLTIDNNVKLNEKKRSNIIYSFLCT